MGWAKGWVSPGFCWASLEVADEPLQNPGAFERSHACKDSWAQEPGRSPGCPQPSALLSCPQTTLAQRIWSGRSHRKPIPTTVLSSQFGFRVQTSESIGTPAHSKPGLGPRAWGDKMELESAKSKARESGNLGTLQLHQQDWGVRGELPSSEGS